jgi:hypothetical protein
VGVFFTCARGAAAAGRGRQRARPGLAAPTSPTAFGPANQLCPAAAKLALARLAPASAQRQRRALARVAPADARPGPRRTLGAAAFLGVAAFFAAGFLAAGFCAAGFAAAFAGAIVAWLLSEAPRRWDVQ